MRITVRVVISCWLIKIPPSVPSSFQNPARAGGDPVLLPHPSLVCLFLFFLLRRGGGGAARLRDSARWPEIARRGSRSTERSRGSAAPRHISGSARWMGWAASWGRGGDSAQCGRSVSSGRKRWPVSHPAYLLDRLTHTLRSRTWSWSARHLDPVPCVFVMTPPMSWMHSKTRSTCTCCAMRNRPYPVAVLKCSR